MRYFWVLSKTTKKCIRKRQDCKPLRFGVLWLRLGLWTSMPRPERHLQEPAIAISWPKRICSPGEAHYNGWQDVGRSTALEANAIIVTKYSPGRPKTDDSSIKTVWRWPTPASLRSMCTRYLILSWIWTKRTETVRISLHVFGSACWYVHRKCICMQEIKAPTPQRMAAGLGQGLSRMLLINSS